MLIYARFKVVVCGIVNLTGHATTVLAEERVKRTTYTTSISKLRVE